MLKLRERDMSEMGDNLSSKEVHSLCRLCLSDKDVLLDIFDKGPLNDSLLLASKIRDSIAIEITDADKLPTRVCRQCCEFVDKIYSFKQKCLAADCLLHKHLKMDPDLKEGCGSSPIFSSEQESCSFQVNGSKDCDISDKSDVEEIPVVMLGNIEGVDIKYDPEMLDVMIKEEDEDIHFADDLNKKEQEKLVGQGGIKSKWNPQDNVSLKAKFKESRKKKSKYVCHSCGKIFCRKFSLKRHLLSHSEKTSSCYHCKKVFKNHESKLRHEKLHFEEKPYKCQYCEKSYMSSTSHAAHVRKHTGERPFKCSLCAETFYRTTSFERHVAKHTGIKNYECEICNASFWVADDLRAHVNRVH